MSTLAFRVLAILTSFLVMTGALPASPQEGEHINSDGRLPRYEARFGRMRPVIAVVGYNPSTELTDYVVPYGVLAESGSPMSWPFPPAPDRFK